MADEAGPSTPPAVAVAAAPQQSKSSPSNSFNEAMLWTPVESASDAFDASDACSGTSTFQLPELSSSHSGSRRSTPEPPHNDLISSWISNYMATSQPDFTAPAAVAEPAAFMNAVLDVPSLPDWNTSSFESPPPTAPKWMPIVQAPGPDLPLQRSPAAEHFARSSWRAETSISPSPEWNNSVASFPVQRGEYQTVPARRELFRPHSAAASTHHHGNLSNMQGAANAFGQGGVPVPFLAPGNASLNAPMPRRPSWLTPIESWTTNYEFPASYNNYTSRLEQGMMQAQQTSARPYSSELSRLLPAVIATPPPLLTTVGSPVGNMPSWFPRANALLPSIPHPGFQSLSGPGESSTPSRKRSNFAMQMEDHSGMQWAHSQAPNRAEWGSSPTITREVMALGPALNTNGQPRASRGSATDPQSVYARFRREKISGRIKTLQELVPNGTNFAYDLNQVDIVTMLDEAHDWIKFLEHQVELLKSDENWKSATPYIYKGMDLSKPLPPKPSPGRLGDKAI